VTECADATEIMLIGTPRLLALKCFGHVRF